MKIILLHILLFLFCFSISFSTEKEAATNVINFLTSNFTEKFEIRDLNDTSKEDKIIIKIKNKIYSLYKGVLNGGSDKIIETKLYEGYDYIFIASGDSIIKDLDIYIYDSNDNVVAIDRSTRKDGFPVLTKALSKTQGLNCDIQVLGQLISVRPKNSGMFKIKIKNRTDEGTKGNWAMLVGNKKVP